jgi:hypothetical protein
MTIVEIRPDVARSGADKSDAPPGAPRTALDVDTAIRVEADQVAIVWAGRDAGSLCAIQRERPRRTFAPAGIAGILRPSPAPLMA